jgi:hypothetical protein
LIKGRKLGKTPLAKNVGHVRVKVSKKPLGKCAQPPQHGEDKK